jgi:hypothetical protein
LKNNQRHNAYLQAKARTAKDARDGDVSIRAFCSLGVGEDASISNTNFYQGGIPYRRQDTHHPAYSLHGFPEGHVSSFARHPREEIGIWQIHTRGRFDTRISINTIYGKQ